jgi:hypothetical protein
MRFFCRYCGIHWELTEFQEIEDIQATQCYITVKGVTHDLKAVRLPGNMENGGFELES